MELASSLYARQNLNCQNEYLVNFLFFMIPLTPPPKYISEMHSLISQFIWGGKHVRIKLTTLQRSKLTRGLANLNFYFYAFQIRPLQVWRHSDSQVPW